MPPLDIVLPISVKRVEKSAARELPAANESSHAAGFAAGYEEGKLRAEWEAKRLREKENKQLQAHGRTLQNLHKEFETLLAEHLPDLIHGALSRVFKKHPFTTEEISNEINKLLLDMEQASRIAVECMPDEAAELTRLLEEAQCLPDDAKWSLEGNPTLKRGEFILKSDLGDIDGRHSTRIRQIHHALEAAA